MYIYIFLKLKLERSEVYMEPHKYENNMTKSKYKFGKGDGKETVNLFVHINQRKI